MSANKPHKGVLKRFQITKTGKVKHKSAFSKHLKSSKAPDRLRRLREDKYLTTAEAKAMERLLFRRLRGRTQPLSAIRRSPSPEESRKLKAEKQAARQAAVKAAE
ncbi:MAG: hypothetical protein C0475_00860 [Planctomyces sp.]|nr:hypothetical protein [Planctomyces sp.]